MAVTKETFLTAYPEFADKADAVITNVLNTANTLISNTAFGEARDIAVMLLMAHRLALRFPIEDPNYLPPNMAGGINNVQSSTGGVTISADSSIKQDGTNFENDLARTTYGRELQTLIDAVIAPGQLVW